MKINKKFYKAAFWIAVIVIVILAIVLSRIMNQPEESVSYLDENGTVVGEDVLVSDGDDITGDVVAEEDVMAEEEVVAEEEVMAEEEVVAEDISNEELQFVIVLEGELVSFPNLEAADPDGDEITFTFSEPLDENGEWQTEVGDAGNYEVIITASDGLTEITENVLIIVESSNKAPVIEMEDSVSLFEGESIVLEPVVSDPEGDAIEISYSGWMKSNVRETGFDDAGEHEVVITASDGKAEVEKIVTVIVKDVNRKPTFVSII